MLLTRQIISKISLAKNMSGAALERIIANNKVAEQSLEALKREVIAEKHCTSEIKVLTIFYAIFSSSQHSAMSILIGK
jgi:hypothetical protein